MDPRDDSEYGYSDDWTSVDGEHDGAQAIGPGWAGSAQPLQYASDAGLDGPAERSGNRLATAGTVAPSAERAMAAHGLSACGPETVNTVHGSAGGPADDGALRFNDEPTALAAGGRGGEQRVDAVEPDCVRPSNAQAATPTTGCGVKPTSGSGGERQDAGDGGEKCIFPELRECSYLGRYYYNEGVNQEYKAQGR